VSAAHQEDFLVRKKLPEVFSHPLNTRAFESFQSKKPFKVSSIKNESVEISKPALDNSKEGCGSMLSTRAFPQFNLLHDTSLRQMSDRNCRCSLRDSHSCGNFVYSVNNVRAVIAVSAHITDANRNIL